MEYRFNSAIPVSAFYCAVHLLFRRKRDLTDLCIRISSVYKVIYAQYNKFFCYLAFQMLDRILEFLVEKCSRCVFVWVVYVLSLIHILYNI